MSERLRIRGRGGKSGGGGGVDEADDTLQSHAYARVLDLVSEGEIEGLVDGLKSIYYDGTPLQNADDSFNFDGLVAWRYGTQGQDHIPGFDGIENEIAVGVEIENGTPVIRSITNPDIDAVQVRLSVPSGLYDATSGKRITGSRVQYAIDLQSNGGGYVEVATRGIYGKTRSKYETAVRVELSGDPPYDIRVRRITADSESSTLVNALQWESYTEIVDAKLRYPNSALIAHSFDSAQWSSIPTRSFHLRGVRVKVPANYDPETREYATEGAGTTGGVWDGSFKIAWTDNPAWLFFAVATNKRWGLGRRITEDQVDKWSIYEIGRYCDELVPGEGGNFEPRFRCFLYYQTRRQAWKVLDELAAVFRGLTYWGAGAVVPIQDSPRDPVCAYTAANVVDGKFVRSGSSKDARFTRVVVYYNDPTDAGARKPWVEDDHAAIARWGLIPKEIEGVGCPSRTQAQRLALYVLATSQREKETIQFGAGGHGAYRVPGDVIEIHDPARAGSRLGGRLLAATTTSINVDAPVTLQDGVTYTLTVMFGQDRVTRTLSNDAGETSVLNVTEAFDVAPEPMSIWILGSDAIAAELFRVLSVTESDGAYMITAVAHEPAKFDYADAGRPMPTPAVSSLYARPGKPANLVAQEQLYIAGTTELLQAFFSWDAVTGAAQYVGTLTGGDENPIPFDTRSPGFELLNATPETYTLNVWAVSHAGKRSEMASQEFTLDGEPDPPPGLESFNMTADTDRHIAMLSWPPPSIATVRSGGDIVVRWFNGDVATATWETGTELGVFPGNSAGGEVSLLDGTYMGRTRDYRGVLSDAISVIEYGDVSGGVLAATASPATFQTYSPLSQPLTGNCTVTASGGTGARSYAWSLVSGSGIDALSPTASVTQFQPSSPLAVGDVVTAVFECTVEDEAEYTVVTNQVSVSIRRDEYTSTCVEVSSVLPDGRRADEVVAGSIVCTGDQADLVIGTRTVESALTATARCWEITTLTGIQLICSWNAPIPTLHHGLVAAAELTTHHWIGVLVDGMPRWEPVRASAHVGMRQVRQISIDNRCFWAGAQPGRFILHHNIANK